MSKLPFFEPEPGEPELLAPQVVELKPRKPEPTQPRPLEPHNLERQRVEPELVEPTLPEPEPIELEFLEPEPIELEFLESEPIELEFLESEPIELEFWSRSRSRPSRTSPSRTSPSRTSPSRSSRSRSSPEPVEPELDKARPVRLELLGPNQAGPVPIDAAPGEWEPVEPSIVGLDFAGSDLAGSDADLPADGRDGPLPDEPQTEAAEPWWYVKPKVPASASPDAVNPMLLDQSAPTRSKKKKNGSDRAPGRRQARSLSSRVAHATCVHPGAFAAVPSASDRSVEHLAHLARELGRRVGLLDERIELAAASSDRFAGVTGHEEHSHTREPAEDPLGEVEPVHLRHDQIGEQEVDRPVVVLGQPEGCLGAFGGEHGVAVAAQDAGSQHAHGLLVLGDQDRLGARRRDELERRLGLGGPSASEAGQVDLEARACRFAVDPDVAAALLDDPVDGRESEAGPGPIGLVVKNGSKMRAIVSASMPTGVADREHRVAARACASGWPAT